MVATAAREVIPGGRGCRRRGFNWRRQVERRRVRQLTHLDFRATFRALPGACHNRSLWVLPKVRRAHGVNRYEH